jgi:hypothetical protein
MHRDSAGSRQRRVNLAGNLHGIKREIDGNRVTGRNNSLLEVNLLKIMAGALILLLYNNK